MATLCQGVLATGSSPASGCRPRRGIAQGSEPLAQSGIRPVQGGAARGANQLAERQRLDFVLVCGRDGGGQVDRSAHFDSPKRSLP